MSIIMKDLMMMDLGSPIPSLLPKIKMFSLVPISITRECMRQVAEQARQARAATICSGDQRWLTGIHLMTDLATDGPSILTCKRELILYNSRLRGLRVM